MMKTLAPQRCIPRTSQPSVTSLVMCSTELCASEGEGL